MAYSCVHYSTLRIANGPLKGKKYGGGHEGFVYLDEENRQLYIYRAVSPPHRRLRKKSAYFVDSTFGPLTERQMWMIRENNVMWGA